MNDGIWFGLIKMFTVFCVLIEIEYVISGPTSTPVDIDDPDDYDDVVLPWIGVLRVTDFFNKTQEAATGLILIHRCVCVGNANEINHIDKSTMDSTTRAMFLNQNAEPMFFSVFDYILHPEFNEKSNTLALVVIDCAMSYENADFVPVRWPTRDILSSASYIDPYAVGYTDEENQELEQVVYKMNFVPTPSCFDFYEKEGLNYKSLNPKYYHCFVVPHLRWKCVFESGMALATNSTGEWVLLGISVRGPGCGLPSRFMDFSPYLSWIVSIITGTRRIIGYGKNHNTPSPPYIIPPRQPYYIGDTAAHQQFIINQMLKGFENRPRDTDNWIFSRIKYDTIMLKKNTGAADIHPQNCSQSVENLALMYREETTLMARGLRAVGVYALSLFDLHFDEISCIMVAVKSKQRTNTTFWLDKGFGQFDSGNLVETIPIPPLTKNEKDNRVFFLTEEREAVLNKREMAHMYLKFGFKSGMTLKVDVFGPMQPVQQFFKQRTTTTTTTKSGDTTEMPTYATRHHTNYSKPTFPPPEQTDPIQVTVPTSPRPMDP